MTLVKSLCMSPSTHHSVTKVLSPPIEWLVCNCSGCQVTSSINDQEIIYTHLKDVVNASQRLKQHSGVRLSDKPIVPTTKTFVSETFEFELGLIAPHIKEGSTVPCSCTTYKIGHFLGFSSTFQLQGLKRRGGPFQKLHLRGHKCSLAQQTLRQRI